MVAPAVLQAHAIRGAAWTAVHTVTSVPIALVANAVVARVLGVADYGRLAVLTLALFIASQVANAGVDSAAIQWGAAAHARGNRSQVDGLLRRALGFRLLIQFPLLAVMVVVLGHATGPWVMGALLASVTFPAVLGSAALSISIENRTAGAAKLAMFSNLIVQVGIAAVALASHSTLGVWAMRSVAASVLLPANFLLLDRARRRVALRPAMPRQMPAGFWRFALLTMVGGLVGMLVFSRSELLVLQGMHGAAAAGLFALGFGLAQQITAPVDAMLGPLAPAVAGIVEAHPHLQVASLLRATRVGALLSAGIMAVACPAIFFLIPLVYGSSFAGTAPVFLALGAVSCVQSLINPFLAFVRARKRSGLLLRINLIALTVDVVLAVALIPVLGVWGAVIANMAGQVAVLLPLALSELHQLGIGFRQYLSATGLFWFSVLAALATVTITSIGQFPASFAALYSTVLGVLLLLLGAHTIAPRIPASDLAPGLAALPRPLSRPARIALSPFLSNSPETR